MIAQHNLLLLERLEKIHQHHVPKQFDVSHLSDEVLNAPRASNASLRRREQQQIERENAKLRQRLANASTSKGLCSNKQLARDADKHRYLADQISKVARRRRVQEVCQALSDKQPPLRRRHADNDNDCERSWLEYDDSYAAAASPGARLPLESIRHGADVRMVASKSLSRLDRDKKSGFRAPNVERLPLLASHRQQTHAQTQHQLVAGHATLAHTTKLISALDLQRS